MIVLELEKQLLRREVLAPQGADVLTDKNRSAALLRAAGLVGGMTPTLRALHDVRLWRDLIRQAQKGAVGLTAPASGERSPG